MKTAVDRRMRATNGSQASEMAPEPTLRFVCAWCTPASEETEPGTTHGICPTCLERQLGHLAHPDDGAVWRNMRHRLTLE